MLGLRSVTTIALTQNPIKESRPESVPESIPESIPMIRAGRSALVLAPMEGVTDSPMRALLTERGGIDFCVSEFLRVSQEIPPLRTFLEYIPELRTRAATAA